MGNRIVILHPGSLGDVLLAVPAMQALFVPFPESQRILVAKAEIGRLLQSLELIDEVVNYDSSILSDLLSECHEESPRVKYIFGHCTHVVGWLADSNQHLQNKLKNLGIPEVWIGSPHQHSLAGIHQSDRFCEILGLGGYSGQPCMMGPNMDETLLSRPAQHKVERTEEGKGRMTIFIHPGSGSPHKCLSPQNVSQIIKWLGRGDNRQILLSEGPADKELVSVILAMLPPLKYTLLKDRSLVEMAHALQTSDLYLGCDSGMTHLAATLGIPTIALFGPTDPKRWAPRGANVHVIQGHPCQCKDWQMVQQCREKPCLNHSIDAVVAVAEHLLGQRES